MTAAFLLVALPLGVPSLVSGVAPVAPTQFQEEAMRADELEESRALAASFVQRFSETHDLEPLIDEFFVDVFIDYLRDLITEQGRPGRGPLYGARHSLVFRLSGPSVDPIVDPKGLVLFVVSPDVAPQLSDEDLQRYYVHTVNFRYLAALFALREYYPRWIPRGMTLADLLPPESVGLLDGDPILHGTVGASVRTQWIQSPVVVENVEEFRRATATLEGVNAIMRSRAARPDALQADRYEYNIRDFGVSMERRARERLSFRARATVCASECRRFPGGTRFLEIQAHPLLHLHLVEADGRLRILFIDLPTS